MRKTYIGIIQNDRWDIKTLVLAENPGMARARVLENMGPKLGSSFRDEDLQIIAFGERG